MGLTNTYVQTYGHLERFFAKIQEGQAPDQFTHQQLVDFGFTSSNHRTYIKLMKELGFLTPEGLPTSRYHDYRNRAHARAVMGAALRDAYGDLFVIKENPTEKDRKPIEGKFKSAHNVSDRVAQLMAKTFYALLALADIGKARTAKGKPEKPQELPPKGKPVKKPETPAVRDIPPLADKPTLHYNIQIHLPPTKDVEVFNAIFKSLKEHLLE